MAKGKYKRKRQRRQRQMSLIKDSGLSIRVVKILNGAGIDTLADLDSKTDEMLEAIPGIGEKALQEIHGIQWASFVN